MLTHISTFSGGLDGASVAAYMAGFQTTALCEIDPWNQNILRHHWPEARVYGDIRDVTRARFTADGVGIPTVLSGGPPCQAASAAGKRRGDADDRWLWPEYIRVVGDLEPDWIVAENPVGLLSLRHADEWGRPGRGEPAFGGILRDLSALGYVLTWGTWGAAHVGAPHNRERVFLIGRRDVAYAAHSGRTEQSEVACVESAMERAIARASGGTSAGDLTEGIPLARRIDAAGVARLPGGVGLADPQGARLQEQRQPCGDGAARPRLAGGGQDVALGEGHGRREGWPESAGQQGRPDAAECCPDVAITDGGRQRTRQRDDDAGQSDTAWRGAAVAVTDRGRCRGRALGGRWDIIDGPQVGRLKGDGGAESGGQVGVREQGPALTALGAATHGLAARLARLRWPAGQGPEQYPWEEARLVAGRVPWRKEMLRACGNGIVWQQIWPIFAAIAEIEGAV